MAEGEPKIALVGHSFVESRYGRWIPGASVDNEFKRGEGALSTISRFNELEPRRYNVGIIHTGINDIAGTRGGGNLEDLGTKIENLIALKQEIEKKREVLAAPPVIPEDRTAQRDAFRKRQEWMDTFRSLSAKASALQEQIDAARLSAPTERKWEMHLEKIRGELEKACETALEKKGMKHIVLVEITPFGGWPHWSQTLERRAKEYNNMLAEVAGKFGGRVSVMETYKQFESKSSPGVLDHNLAGRDGLHLSSEGYKRMADLAANHLRELGFVQEKPLERKPALIASSR